MAGRRRKFIYNNSPVIMGFTLACFVVLLLGMVTGDMTNRLFFSVYRASLKDPLTYIRFVGHIFGHSGWQHFFNNMLMIVIIGPMLEEKYGSDRLMVLILITALTTGIIHFIFFPGSALLGASGVAFAFLLLGSITRSRDGAFPLTFVLVAVVYLGDQVYQGLFVKDNVANLTHIIGGVVGALYGFTVNKRR